MWQLYTGALEILLLTYLQNQHPRLTENNFFAENLLADNIADAQ